MPAMNSSLVGKRAVVTGGGRGIGRSIALALAEAGADVAVSGRTQSEIESVADEIRAIGRVAQAVVCDVTDAGQVQSFALDVLNGPLGGVDILVNNAGNAGSARFATHPDDLWHRMLAINLTSVYYVTKAFAPAMIAQRSGRIITVASIASKVGAKYIAAYTASKHGALGLTRALAVELNPHNITVNAICPGYVDTPMNALIFGDDAFRAAFAADHAMGLQPPGEIAALAVFLASDDASSMTGSVVTCDRGWTAFKRPSVLASAP